MDTMDEKESYQKIAEKLTSDLLTSEVSKLKEALRAKDYPEARWWAKELKITISEISKYLEARK